MQLEKLLDLYVGAHLFNPKLNLAKTEPHNDTRIFINLV